MKILQYLSLVVFVFLMNQCKKGPEYESLIPYQEDENAYWGYMNFNGHKKIDPGFKSRPGMFYNGYALIKTTDGSMDFIDRKGHEYERNYLDATDFGEGIAFAVKESEYPTLLNSKLEEVKVLDKVDELFLPSAGLVCFKNTQGKWGYLNLKGEISIQPVWDYAFSFSEGLALVGKNEADTMKEGRGDKVLYGFIDTRGNEVIKPTAKFMVLRSFSEGLAAYSDGDEWGWGFIDKTGKKMIRAKQEWENVTDFHEGLASVKIDDLWGAIDKKGKLVIHAKFEVALQFENGLSYGEKEDKIGFINKKGEWVIEPSFDNIEAGFAKGKAIVEKDNYYIFINRKGNQTGRKEFFNIGISANPDSHVRSDFFDIEPVIDTLITQLNAGSVNGISRETSLEAVMKLYKLNNAALPDNTWENSLNVREINMDEEISCTITCHFSDNVSQSITRRVSYGWYAYNEVVGYRPNSAVQVESLSFDISLEGRKEGKGDKLAKGIRSVFERNGFKSDKEAGSVDYFVLTAAEGGSQATIRYTDDHVAVSVKF